MTNAKLLSRGESLTGSNSGDLSSHEPVQVEPKTYFANERTFIQWISASLLLLTVSSIMMSSGNYNGTSSVIAFASLVLVAYAAYVYFRRVKLLRSGKGYGYLDFVGPSILAAGVGVGVFIVFADAVKGSEFVPFGTETSESKSNRRYSYKDDDDDRRFLRSALEMPQDILELHTVEGKCSRYSIDGINLLEYQPRDILLDTRSASPQDDSELIVATPQALISHHLIPSSSLGDGRATSALKSEMADTELQSITLVGDRLLALSMGPSKTELIEWSMGLDETSRYLIQDSTSTVGSMVFVPSSVPSQEGKLYIYLDGTMHTYHLPPSNNNNNNNNDSSSSSSSSSSTLSRVGSINMKVLNRGGGDDNHSGDHITAMEYFQGLVYVLREKQNTIQAWDFNTATLIAEMTLPTLPGSKNDHWVGMAFQRREEEENEDAATTKSTVYLHMPLDSFPPQLWSFRLEEHFDNIFTFPECSDGAAMN